MFLGEEIRLVSDPMPEQRELIQPLLSYRINGYYDDKGHNGGDNISDKYSGSDGDVDGVIYAVIKGSCVLVVKVR